MNGNVFCILASFIFAGSTCKLLVGSGGMSVGFKMHGLQIPRPHFVNSKS